MPHFKNHILLGSALAVVASLGIAPRAIALPDFNPSESQSQQVAQDVDPMQVRVPGTVVAVDSDFGEIRVDLGDGTIDTIYLGNAEINELGLDVGEEVTVIYQDDDPIALIRGDEVVTLNADIETGTTTTTTPSADVSEPGIFEEEPDILEEDDSDVMIETETSQTDTTIQQRETYQTTPTPPSPAASEPVPGLW